MAVPGDQEGVVTLVSAADTELASEEVAALESGNDLGNEAPAATEAPTVAAG